MGIRTELRISDRPERGQGRLVRGTRGARAGLLEPSPVSRTECTVPRVPAQYWAQGKSASTRETSCGPRTKGRYRKRVLEAQEPELGHSDQGKELRILQGLKLGYRVQAGLLGQNAGASVPKAGLLGPSTGLGSLGSSARYPRWRSRDELVERGYWTERGVPARLPEPWQ